MSNETKRDVLVNAVDALADAQASSDNVRGAKINEINADKAAKAMSELGKNLVIYSKNDKAATAMPQSVSEYISAMKDIHVSLYEAMGWHMAPKWLKRNSEEFARAWLYGYKIEEEEK